MGEECPRKIPIFIYFVFTVFSITYYRVTGNGAGSEVFPQSREKLEEYLATARGNCRTRTYLTLDNSDLILVLMSKSYTEGAELIDFLHRGKGFLEKTDWMLSYSYTTASLYKEVLNSDTPMGEETVSFVYIYAIEKFPGSIDYVYNELLERVGETFLKKEKQSTLGCNDELIVLENIPWKMFRELYKDKEGILNHSSSFYQKYLLGVTTIIGKTTQTDPHKVSIETESLETGQETLSRILMERFERIILEKGEDSVRLHGLLKNLYQVLNSMQRFETTSFPDYMFRSILLPLNMVSDLMEKAFDEDRENDLFESFHSLFKGINLYAQNSIKSDRQFTQSLDFNIRLYHTPVKLNAFYNAYLYNLKNYLSSLDRYAEKHEYEFIACPGMNDNMQVQELFSSLSEIKKIYLVSIPEKQIYDMKLMMVMLGHEVGHFVGREIRSRDVRSGVMVKILSHITVCYYREELDREYPCCSELNMIEEFWESLEMKIESEVSDCLDRYEDPDYLRSKFSGIDDEGIEEWCSDFGKYEFYSRILNELLKECIEDVLFEKEEKLFSYLLEKEYIQKLGKKGEKEAAAARNALWRYLRSITFRWISFTKWNRHRQCISAVMELLVEFVKECVADLMVILTLKLSMYDYLQSLLQCAEDQDAGRKLDTKSLLRAILVTRCMHGERSVQQEFQWGNEEIAFIRRSGDPALNNLKNQILKGMEYYFGVDSNTVCVPEPQYRDTALWFFSDSTVLTLIARYLRSCKKKFNENNTQRQQQEALQEIYQKIGNSDIENVTLEIQKYISNYQRLIEDRIQQLILEKRSEGESGRDEIRRECV